jgi:hypothetical protein
VYALYFLSLLESSQVWQQGLDSFVIPRRNFGKRDWRWDLTLSDARTPETASEAQPWVKYQLARRGYPVETATTFAVRL